MIQALGIGTDGQMFVLGLTRQEVQEMLDRREPFFIHFRKSEVIRAEDVRALLVIVGESDQVIADAMTKRWEAMGGAVTRTDTPACHYLSGGRTLCHMNGEPDSWPPGHSWVTVPAQAEADDPAVTCAVCLMTRRKGLHP